MEVWNKRPRVIPYDKPQNLNEKNNKTQIFIVKTISGDHTQNRNSTWEMADLEVEKNAAQAGWGMGQNSYFFVRVKTANFFVRVKTTNVFVRVETSGIEWLRPTNTFFNSYLNY